MLYLIQAAGRDLFRRFNLQHLNRFNTNDREDERFIAKVGFDRQCVGVVECRKSGDPYLFRFSGKEMTEKFYRASVEYVLRYYGHRNFVSTQEVLMDGLIENFIDARKLVQLRRKGVGEWVYRVETGPVYMNPRLKADLHYFQQKMLVPLQEPLTEALIADRWPNARVELIAFPDRRAATQATA